MTRTRNMNASALASVSLAVLLSSTGLAAEKPVPTLEEIDAAITAAWAGVKNLHVRTSVHIVKDGTDHTWQETATWADHLGRCRHEVQDGVYNQQMQRQPTTSECSIYDGKMTASFDYNYSYNKGPKNGDGSKTQVSLFDGLNSHPYSFSIFPRNTPLGVIDARPTINSQENQELKISWLADGNQLQIDYIRPAEFRHTLVIDPSKNWMLMSHTTSDLNGKITSAHEIEGAENLGPYWIPTTYKLARPKEFFWQPSKFAIDHADKMKALLPKKEFKLSERRIPPLIISRTYDLVEINHDDFDHAKFDIILKKGMYVWDSRLKVNFFVRDETLTTDDLERVAK